ncbi:MAG: hypothetical protein FWG80_05030 [Alphaproteobacteria bacterium]|nr:hypothetical protein [Alphaproteobacteria bacterium]
MKKLSAICYLFSILFLIGCAGQNKNANHDGQGFQPGGSNAPYLNDRTMQALPPENPFYGVDSRRPKTLAEKIEKNDKWETSRMETRWQEYKGTMVRIEVLLGSSDMREMRLKLIQNANGADVDGDIREVLGTVADHEIKRVCGRNSRQYVIIYDQPSFEVLRPTPYFDYMTQDEGVTMREYGFRCIYKER